MWQATQEQLAAMQEEIGKIVRGGDPAWAQAWTVWAEVHIHTLDQSGPKIASTEKVLPLALTLSKSIGIAPPVIVTALHDTLPRLMFKAKLESRELGKSDGLEALRMIASSLGKADG